MSSRTRKPKIKSDPAEMETEVDLTNDSSNDEQQQHQEQKPDPVTSKTNTAPIDISSSADSDDIDSDDEIVREIDVFISPTLTTHLNVVQFPLRPATTHPRALLPDAARIRPNHNMLELDFSIDMDRFSRERQIPSVLNLTHRTMASHSVPPVTHMCIGVMGADDKSLHITPLTKPIVQLRPTFSHVDALYDDDEDGEKAEAAEREAEKKAERERTLQPLTYKKKENDRTLDFRRNSYAYKKASEDGEEWIPLTVHGAGDEKRREARKQVMCRNRGNVLKFKKEEVKYVQSLNYLPATADSAEAKVQRIEGDEEDVFVRELTSKICVILQKGIPVPFGLVKNRFENVEEKDLITALSGCAVVVRGNFVLKSSLAAIGPSVKDARDAIFILMNKYGMVQRERLSGFGVTEEVLNQMMSHFGRYVGNGWEMKFDDDDSFAFDYPEFAKVYQDYWKRKEDELENYLEIYENYYEEQGSEEEEEIEDEEMEEVVEE